MVERDRNRGRRWEEVIVIVVVAVVEGRWWLGVSDRSAKIEKVSNLVWLARTNLNPSSLIRSQFFFLNFEIQITDESNRY